MNVELPLHQELLHVEVLAYSYYLRAKFQLLKGMHKIQHTSIVQHPNLSARSSLSLEKH